MSAKAGIYRDCRGVAGSEQYGVKNDKDHIALDVYIPELERSFTTFLYFTDAAAPYSMERLRALGWKGGSILDLTGIDQNDVDVQVKYETFDGEERMKVDIMTGGGRVKLENQMDDRQKRAFAARMKSFMGSNGASAPARPAAPPPANRREGAFDPGPPGDDDIPF